MLVAKVRTRSESGQNPAPFDFAQTQVLHHFRRCKGKIGPQDVGNEAGQRQDDQDFPAYGRRPAA
jgi:hypothetical protein